MNRSYDLTLDNGQIVSGIAMMAEYGDGSHISVFSPPEMGDEHIGDEFIVVLPAGHSVKDGDWVELRGGVDGKLDIVIS